MRSKTTGGSVAKAAEERLFLRARRALGALSPEARSRLFREAGLCGCADLARAAVRHPVAAAGAVLGGIFGFVASGASAAEKKGG